MHCLDRSLPRADFLPSHVKVSTTVLKIQLFDLNHKNTLMEWALLVMIWQSNLRRSSIEKLKLELEPLMEHRLGKVRHPNTWKVGNLPPQQEAGNNKLCKKTDNPNHFLCSCCLY